MSSTLDINKHNGGERLYLPNVALFFLPRFAAIYSFIFLVTGYLSFVTDTNRSKYLASTILTCVILLLVNLSCISAIYLIFKRFANIVSVRGDKLLLVKNKQVRDFELAAIDHFLILTETSVAGMWGLQRKKFYIVDQTGKREWLYANDMANMLKKSWEKAGIKLSQMTGKPVVFKYLVEELDGQTIEVDEFRQQQFKRVPLFKNPYK